MPPIKIMVETAMPAKLVRMEHREFKLFENVLLKSRCGTHASRLEQDEIMLVNDLLDEIKRIS